MTKYSPHFCNCKGQYSHQFTTPGSYYYTGFNGLIQKSSTYMRGVVYVHQREIVPLNINVLYLNISAAHAPTERKLFYYEHFTITYFHPITL